MHNHLKVLFIASEATPLAKTGGLADVVGSLPKELRRLGHDVRLIIPRYRTIAVTEATGTPLGVALQVHGRLENATLEQTSIGDIPVYLLRNDFYFDREFLYGSSLGDYPDNHRRFSFFCRAALLVMAKIGFVPDIIHCHDWQAALVPLLLSRFPDEYAVFRHSATLFTIHNLSYQGIFPADSASDMGLPPELFSAESLEYYGMVNLMKGAIVGADCITTVSETYLKEILGPEQGCGLEGVLETRKKRLAGIVNGIDYEIWDPATDREIFCNYSITSPEGKAKNKEELQKTLGLEVNPEVPLFGVVSRIVAQKGFDLLADILPRLLEDPLQLVILGTGEEKYLHILNRLREKYPGKLSVTVGFAGWLAPKIYAGADIFLMPSHFEPCGLGQLIALRYGTVPLVRATGGLADTVTDVGDTEKGTGFVFSDYSAEALYQCIRRSIRAFRQKEQWKTIMRRGMAEDFSWTRSALRYEQLYLQAVKEKKDAREE